VNEIEPKRQWLFAEQLDAKNRNLTVRALSLIMLRTHDLDRSRRFYEAIGLRFFLSRYGNGPSYIHGPVPPDAPVILNLKTDGIPPPNTCLEIQEVKRDQPIAPQQIGFFVGSVDAAADAAIEAGGVLLTPAADWPYGRRAAVADPDGHRVELSEHPSGRLTGDYPK